MDPQIQICVLDFRPEYQRRELVRPSFDEMMAVRDTLIRVGLRTVICQTECGHIGPGSPECAEKEP